ncbi:MAG: nagA [Burkholderiales bacterium]|jgi:N-acetylglucosamine-6-phosphate deacetylase|nr:nagA [Burkholderiales bacterium]
MQKVYTAKYVFSGSDLLENAAVCIQNGIIQDVISLDKLANKNVIQDYGDCIITPGFIDLQLNGCGGVLFNDDINHNALEIMHQTSLKYGTTNFLPTLTTCEFKNVIKALETIKSWFEKYGANRGVLGLHLEGPFISVTKKGIHPERFIISPTDELLSQITAYQKYFPIKMTIAPEVFTDKQIKFLIDNNIIVSLGHSNASYMEARNAISLGAQTSTHIFNAMSGLTARSPGIIAAILNSNIYTGVITDLRHVDQANIQLLSKLKPEHTYLVTDAVTSMGTDMTEFKFAGNTIYVKNDMCVDENGTLAGANLTMPQAVGNCIDNCQLDIIQVLNMASQIPAKVMGYDNRLGKIKHGFVANLTTFNPKDHTCQII